MLLPTKKCTKCNRVLLACKKNFAKQKTGKYGFKSQCKECRNKYSKEWRENNPEYMKEYNKEYYENNPEYFKQYYTEHYKDNSEYFKQYSKQYYKENKERHNEYMKQYYNDNKEHYKEHHKQWNKDNPEYFKQYYKDNPEVFFNYRNKRRSREENQGRGITKEQWLDMMNFFEWRCAYSGETLSEETRSIDHIIPLAKEGLNEPWNCVPMVKYYNISKNASNINEWYITQNFYSEERLNKIYEWQEYAYNKYYED